MITKIFFNWFQTGCDGNSGEDYDQYIVGKSGVTEIKEHKPQGEGDKWYYDVYFEDNKMERIFNPNTVFFHNPEKHSN